jgi:hypothetical protein
MITRKATAIFILLFATAAAHAQTEIMVIAGAAGSDQPASMPDYCLERDVNCVLEDGLQPPAVIVRKTLEPMPTVMDAADSATTASSRAVGPALVR